MSMRWNILPALLLSACIIQPENLLPTPVDDVPGVQHFGTIAPIPAPGPGLVGDITIYGELATTGTPELSGGTFEFTGIGSEVCIVVDPEVAFWTTHVAATDSTANWRRPDNPYDDGDIDVRVGKTIFYNGTPGIRMGSFVTDYLDELGEVTKVDFDICNVQSQLLDTTVGRSFAGRGTPEFCEFHTEFGVNYTIALDAFGIPFDDSRLGFGMLLIDGPCEDLRFNVTIPTKAGEGACDATGECVVSPGDNHQMECAVRGEAIRPGGTTGSQAAAAGLTGQVWLGTDDVPRWPGSQQFESAFCEFDSAAPSSTSVRDFCRDEERAVDDAGKACSWHLEATDDEPDLERCFCGNNDDRPPGSRG